MRAARGLARRSLAPSCRSAALVPEPGAGTGRPGGRPGEAPPSNGLRCNTCAPEPRTARRRPPARARPSARRQRRARMHVGPRQAAPRARRVILMPKRKWSSALPANSAACSAGLPAGAPRRRAAPGAAPSSSSLPGPNSSARRPAPWMLSARVSACASAARRAAAASARLRSGVSSSTYASPKCAAASPAAPPRAAAAPARARPGRARAPRRTRARQARRPAAPPARPGSDERERRGFVHMGTAKWALGTCPLDCPAIC